MRNTLFPRGKLRCPSQQSWSRPFLRSLHSLRAAYAPCKATRRPPWIEEVSTKCTDARANRAYDDAIHVCYFAYWIMIMGFFACSSPTTYQRSDVKMPTKINVKKHKVDLPQEESFPFRFLPTTDTIAEVTPGLPGMIDKLFVSAGDEVKKGQALFSFVSPEFNAAFFGAEATSNALEALIKRREELSNLLNAGLVKSSDVTSLDVEIARLKTEHAQHVAKKNLFDAPVQHGQVIVRSPLSGIVLESTAIRGRFVRPEDGSILVIRNAQGTRIEVSIPEKPQKNDRFILRFDPSEQRSDSLLRLVQTASRPDGLGYFIFSEADLQNIDIAAARGRIVRIRSEIEQH